MYPETVTEVKKITKEYIENYNFNKGHQSYDYKIPADTYYGHLKGAA